MWSGVCPSGVAGSTSAGVYAFSGGSSSAETMSSRPNLAAKCSGVQPIAASGSLAEEYEPLSMPRSPSRSPVMHAACSGLSMPAGGGERPSGLGEGPSASGSRSGTVALSGSSAHLALGAPGLALARRESRESIARERRNEKQNW